MHRVLSVALLTALSGLAWAEDPVQFQDAALKAAVEEELWTTDPTPTDMLGLTYLYAANLGITDITGLEYAQNLQTLYLRWNQISDISLLAGLTNLEHLDAHGNHTIGDISALSEMANLRTLILRINQIRDISALAGLVSLEKLDLQWNDIRDITSLSGLTKLKYVELQFNRISDISALSALASLEELDLTGNPLALEACEVYIPQILANNAGIDLSFDPCVQYHRMLISRAYGGSVVAPGEGEFFCENGEIVCLEARADPGYVFTNWSGNLWSASNPLYFVVRQDLNVTANFTCLDDPNCDLRPVQFADAALQGVVEQALGVAEPGPPDMLALTELLADDRGITDLTGLEYAVNLLQLDVSDNEIADLSPLSGLDALAYLNLRGNPLNQAAYGVYLPLIAGNNPGIELQYDPPARHEVSIRSTPGGTVPQPGEGPFTFDHGQIIILHAVADPGFVFVRWSGTYQGTNNPASLTVDQDHDIEAVFALALDTLYIDANAPNDPGPDDAGHSDPNENGTAEHPFDSIQEAIDVAADGATLLVYPGVYPESIDLRGKDLCLMGFDPDPNGPLADLPTITGNGADPAVSFVNGEDPNCLLIGVAITASYPLQTGAVLCLQSSPILVNCLIVGNRTTDPHGAAVWCNNSQATLVNCTIADNVGGGLGLIDSQVVLANSIVWANAPNQIALDDTSKPTITYSDIQGGWPDVGNLDADPLFARPGHWTAPDGPEGPVWVPGDYHLRSQAGRWDPQARLWVQDQMTSPGIDAGDPADPVEPEPVPNGGRINLGAYGGTPAASRSTSAVDVFMEYR